MQVDTGSANVVPTITIHDASTVDEKAVTPHQSPASDVPMPGAMPNAAAPAVPDWYKVGWREVGGKDNIIDTTAEQQHKISFESFMNEQYYGDWYHNAAVILFVCRTWFYTLSRH